MGTGKHQKILDVWKVVCISPFLVATFTEVKDPILFLPVLGGVVCLSSVVGPVLSVKFGTVESSSLDIGIYDMGALCGVIFLALPYILPLGN